MRRTGDAAIRENVRAALVRGEARFCEMVLLELWNGARGREELAMLRQLEREVEMLALTPEVWRIANGLAASCRAAGITVPATDVAIAACARHYGAELLHR